MVFCEGDALERHAHQAAAHMVDIADFEASSRERAVPANAREQLVDRNQAGKPTVCARMICCSGRSLSARPSEPRSTMPRTTVASPAEAQKR